MQKWSQRSSPKNKGKEEFLATKQITVLEQPAYSPDLAPSDFFLFPNIKKTLKGRHFDDIDDIRNNTTAYLEAIPQNKFQSFLKGRLGAGIGTLLSKGSTLKATTVVFSNEVCSTFTAMSSRILLSFHVYLQGEFTWFLTFCALTDVTLQQFKISLIIVVSFRCIR